MRNKLLDIFLATLMIFGGGFSAFTASVNHNSISKNDKSDLLRGEGLMTKFYTHLCYWRSRHET